MTKTKKKTTALARRPAKRAVIVRKRRKPGTALALRRPVALKPIDEHTIGDDIALGGLGLVEIKFTPEEEAVLAEPVPIDAIQVKPTKTATPYLSHPGYTRWFNRAFGRAGWALVPAAKPMKSGSSVVCPYVLHIHGKPAAFAMGEQEYHDNNKEQTYGDALEATVASALRRCAKRLGIGLELWDRAWLDNFIRTHCVYVTLDKDDGRGGKARVWRRKTDPPFWNEVGRQQAPRTSSPAPQPSRPPAPAAGSNPAEKEPISDKQLKRLWVIIRNSGRSEVQIKRWLLERFGWDSSRAITRQHYDDVCSAIESQDDLPAGRA